MSEPRFRSTSLETFSGVGGYLNGLGVNLLLVFLTVGSNMKGQMAIQMVERWALNMMLEVK